MERGVTVAGADVVVVHADAARVFDHRALVQMAGRAGRASSRPEGNVTFVCDAVTPAIRMAVSVIEEMNEHAGPWATFGRRAGVGGWASRIRGTGLLLDILFGEQPTCALCSSPAARRDRLCEPCQAGLPLAVGGSVRQVFRADTSEGEVEVARPGTRRRPHSAGGARRRSTISPPPRQWPCTRGPPAPWWLT